MDHNGGQHTFAVDYEPREFSNALKKKTGIWPKHTFMVSTPGVDGSYQFTIINLDDSVRVVEMAHNDHAHLAGKGISYAMIERVRELFQKEVTSSTNNEEKAVDDAESRSIPACKVWLNMVDRGKARWDKVREVFVYDGSDNTAD